MCAANNWIALRCSTWKGLQNISLVVRNNKQNACPYLSLLEEELYLQIEVIVGFVFLQPAKHRHAHAHTVKKGSLRRLINY